MLRGINLHFQDPFENPQTLSKIQSREKSKEIAETVIKHFNAARIWYTEINRKLELPFHKSIISTMHKNNLKFIVNLPSHWLRRPTEDEVKQVVKDFDKYKPIYCTGNELYDSRGFPDYTAALKAEAMTKELTSSPTIYANNLFINRAVFTNSREYPFTHTDLIGYNLYAPIQTLGWHRVTTEFMKQTGRRYPYPFKEKNRTIFSGFKFLLNSYLKLAHKLNKTLILTETGSHFNYNFIRKHLKLFKELNVNYCFFRYGELNKENLKLFR